MPLYKFLMYIVDTYTDKTVKELWEEYNRQIKTEP